MSQVSEARRQSMLYARECHLLPPGLPPMLSTGGIIRISECGREDSADVDSQDRITTQAGVQMRRRDVTLSCCCFTKGDLVAGRAGEILLIEDSRMIAEPSAAVCSIIHLELCTATLFRESRRPP